MHKSGRIPKFGCTEYYAKNVSIREKLVSVRIVFSKRVGNLEMKENMQMYCSFFGINCLCNMGMKNYDSKKTNQSVYQIISIIL